MSVGDAVDFERLLRKASTLPTLPAVAVQVLDLGEDPNAGLAEVAGAVSNDPALSVRLLKAANSPLYASRRNIDNLRQAVSLLGFNTAIALALSFSLEPAGDGGCVDKRHYWRRSLIEAVAARVLAETLQAGQSGRFFLAALLQDIGMLVLETAEPERYAGIVESSPSHDACARAETREFGFDHASIGSYLLQKWSIPEPLWRAVRNSHALGSEAAATEASRLDQCVFFASRLADFFLREESMHAAPPELGAWAERCLGLGAEEMEAALSRIARLLPDYETLFEVTLVREHDVAALLAEARDVLLLRSLKTLQEAGEDKARNEALEARNRVLEQQTYSDQLTGLFNRRWLNEVLAREFGAAVKEGWPLSVAFIDVDHFKRVNDSYGHQVGDAVLASIAEGLMSEMRQSDILARYGGEEFVLVLPGTGGEDAWYVVERLRERLGERRHSVHGKAINVTISIGLTTFRACSNPDDDITSCDALLRAADRALYVAKREGRNRTAVYNRAAD